MGFLGLGLVLGVCPKGYPSVLEGEVIGKMGQTHWTQKSPHTHARAAAAAVCPGGLGLGASAWCEVRLGLFGPILIFLGQKRLNKIQNSNYPGLDLLFIQTGPFPFSNRIKLVWNYCSSKQSPSRFYLFELLTQQIQNLFKLETNRFHTYLIQNQEPPLHL